MIHRWSIARRLFVAHLLFMLALTAIVGTAAFVDARDQAYAEAGRRMAGVATAVADNPLVLRAADSPDPTEGHGRRRRRLHHHHGPGPDPVDAPE
jgi:sensor histidine kinase regulating citrate/malate metabolism